MRTWIAGGASSRRRLDLLRVNHGHECTNLSYVSSSLRRNISTHVKYMSGKGPERVCQSNGQEGRNSDSG